MDDMKQIKKILILVLVILVLQVALSSMILYNLNKHLVSSLTSETFGYTNSFSTTEVISQIMKNSTYVLGNQDSPVAITMFADFECPYCNEAFPVINKLISEYKGRIKFSFHHFPLTEHKNALLAALALEAAGRENKYWDMYNLLIDGYKTQGSKSLEREQILQYAVKLGLDMATFQSDLNEKRGMDIIQNDLNYANELQIEGIPTVYINNQKLEGLQDYEYYLSIIEKELTN